MEAEVTISMNPYLAEILLVNLIKNALRHNISGGELNIELTNQHLKIANSGPALKIDPETMFKRFHTSSSSSESLGLGLSIVQKICTVYGFNVNYSYQNNLHVMQVDFIKGELKKK